MSDLKTPSSSPCYLCNDIFQDQHKYVDRAKEILQEVEFSNILVGTRPDPDIVKKEDEFKVEYNILEAEAFKSHFNREVGKSISQFFNVPPKFDGADVVLVYNLAHDSFNIDLHLKSLFVYGRYQKLIRGIPQTKWPCIKCRGMGCEECNFTGKRYPTSVEELITPLFMKASKATDSSFHGAGREDIDVKMKGTGRPFILELKNPQVRTLDLSKLEQETNLLNKDKVQISELRYSDKSEVIKIKENAKNTIKVYKALVISEKEVSPLEFNEVMKKIKETLENIEIKQRTPIRVSHRRADKVRRKYVYSIDGKYMTSNEFEFIIETQGGTYIKELINGDEGRTQPSFVDVFESSLTCSKLNVIAIKY